MLHLSSSATYYISLTEVQGNFLSLRIKELGIFYSILTLVEYYKMVSGLKTVRQLSLQRKTKSRKNIRKCSFV